MYNLNDSENVFLDKTWAECIGSCHAYLTLREDFRNHVKQIQNEIGFKAIRFHGLFHDLVGVYHGNSNHPIFNFQNVYKIFDFFLSVGMKPLVELSFMPRELASGPQTIFKYAANVTLPKNYEVWSLMIKQLLKALINRYGINEIITWKFEVWNEPDVEAFWPSGKEAYFQLYQYTANAVKAVDDRLMVGGPATSKTLWIQDMINFCQQTETPIDFFSTHHYCSDISLEPGLERSEIHYRDQSIMLQEVERVHHTIKTSEYTDLPIHFTEWNVSPIHEDIFGKDSSFTGTFVLETLRDISGFVQSYAYWSISDIFEESGPGLTPFSGKYGLLNLHGIKKPVYYAYHFLSKLYPYEILGKTKNIIVTKSYRGDIRILCWNHPKVIKENLSGKDYEIKQTTFSYPLRLQGRQSLFRYRSWKVGPKDGNALTVWRHLGEPQYLDDALVAQIQEKSQPTLIKDEIITFNKILDLSIHLDASEFMFIDLGKIE